MTPKSLTIAGGTALFIQSCTWILWTPVPAELTAAYQYADRGVRLDLSPRTANIGPASTLQYKVDSKVSAGTITLWVYAKQAFGPSPGIAGISTTIEGVEPGKYSVIDGSRSQTVGSVTVQDKAPAPGDAVAPVAQADFTHIQYSSLSLCY